MTVYPDKYHVFLRIVYMLPATTHILLISERQIIQYYYINVEHITKGLSIYSCPVIMGIAISDKQFQLLTNYQTPYEYGHKKPLIDTLCGRVLNGPKPRWGDDF